MKNIFVFAVILLLFVRCVKEGPPGPSGMRGRDGSSNVRYDIFDVYPSDWMSDTTYHVRYFIRNTSIITNNAINYGVVQVYIKALHSEEWQPLPYTFPGANQVESFWAKAGSVEVDRESPSGMPPVVKDTITYRIVTIESLSRK